MTTDTIEDQDRHLLTVRDMAMEGLHDKAQRLNKIKRDSLPEGETFTALNPIQMLLTDMANNTACQGAVARLARSLTTNMKGNIKGFESLRNSAAEHMQFLEGKITDAVVDTAAGGCYERTFSIDDIKKKRISIFICLPEGDYDPLVRWLRSLVQLMFDCFKDRQGMPENGERILFCIDEFANLGRLDEISSAINSSAGAGVKTMIAVQRLSDLKKLYEDEWQKFIAAAGTRIYFGLEELETRKFIEEDLGEREERRYTRSGSLNASHSVGLTLGESFTHTHSLSHSYAQSTAHTRSTTQSEGRNSSSSQSISKQINKTFGRSHTTGYGSSDGRSAGQNYGPGIFHPIFASGHNRGENSGTNRNRSRTANRSRSISDGVTNQKTEGTNSSLANTTGETKTETETESESDSKAKGESKSITDNQQRAKTEGIQESIHLRPLLSAREAKQWFKRNYEEDDPAYPGFSLISVADEDNPFFVRRTNYDQDPFFVRKFNPRPDQKYLPLDEQPLFGWQITPEYFYTVREPDIPDRLEVESLTAKKPNSTLKRGDPFLRIEDHKNALEMECLAPLDLKLYDAFDDAHRNITGEIMMLRANKPLEGKDTEKLDKIIWGDFVDAHKERLATAEAEAYAEEARRQKEIDDALHEEERERQRLAREREEREKQRQLAEKQKLILRNKIVGGVAAAALVYYGFLHLSHENKYKELTNRIETDSVPIIHATVTIQNEYKRDLFGLNKFLLPRVFISDDRHVALSYTTPSLFIGAPPSRHVFVFVDTRVKDINADISEYANDYLHWIEGIDHCNIIKSRTYVRNSQFPIKLSGNNSLSNKSRWNSYLTERRNNFSSTHYGECSFKLPNDENFYVIGGSLAKSIDNIVKFDYENYVMNNLDKFD